jgi:glycogen phosphorylase
VHFYGHDHFPMELVDKIIGKHRDFFDMTDIFCIDLVNRVLESDLGHGFDHVHDIFSPGVALNMTYLGLNLSHYINGIPSLSILDGWWCEGSIEGITGWSIENPTQDGDKENDRSKDAASLYEKLEAQIIPTYYHNRPAFIDIMRQAVAINGSCFNTQRMLQQYIQKAYFV